MRLRTIPFSIAAILLIGVAAHSQTMSLAPANSSPAISDATRGHGAHTVAVWKNYLAEFMRATEPKQ